MQRDLNTDCSELVRKNPIQYLDLEKKDQGEKAKPVSSTISRITLHYNNIIVFIIWGYVIPRTCTMSRFMM